MWHAEFRERQVLADLQRVAAPLSVPDPWAAIYAPDATPGSRAAAVAVLMQLILETGTPDPATEDLWLTHRRDFLAQPAPVRAALMNGLDLLRQRGLVPETCRPRPEDCITLPRSGLESALVALARKMTPEEIDHVARADYGCDAARHHEALTTLLADPRLAYPPGDFWYPAEVVELVSHVPGEPGHLPCMAIVLLDALRTGDLHGNAEYRLYSQLKEVLALPEPARSVLVAAFRHLYETERDWNPSMAGGSLPIDQATLPWTDLP